MHLIFTRSVLRHLRKIPYPERNRIIRKLRFYAEQENPLEFAESISDSRFGQYRFRIGVWRVLFDVSKNTIIILKVGHRREIYR